MSQRKDFLAMLHVLHDDAVAYMQFSEFKHIGIRLWLSYLSYKSWYERWDIDYASVELTVYSPSKLL